MSPADPHSPAEGLRNRKRRETAQRITDAGVSLFLERGIEATTLDDIAARAGISRRTFFYYFKSKDDILLSMQSGMGEMLATALRDEPQDKRPLQALRDATIRMAAPYPADQMLAMDRLMRSSPTVMARKQASYIAHEETLFAALCEKWPKGDRTTLRLLALLTIGAVRLSLEAFNRAEGRQPLTRLLAETFAALDGGL
jgi:AcrR family transcriptional regulator